MKLTIILGNNSLKKWQILESTNHVKAVIYRINTLKGTSMEEYRLMSYTPGKTKIWWLKILAFFRII